MYADLHLHTTFSDGRFTPEELVEAAKLVGLRVIAITDHDHTGAIGPARSVAGPGLEVIAGVEINTVENDHEVHILGYYLDHEADWWLDFLARQRELRAQRIERFVERFNEEGIAVELEQVRHHAGEGGAMGRPHLARALVEIGAVSSEQQAFERYLTAGAPTYVTKLGVSPIEAIQAIRKAGGIPSLAHPKSLPLEGSGLIDRLVDAGLGAVEVNHPSHSPMLRDYYAEMAQFYGLAQTGGSDDHGPRDGRPSRIGSDGVGRDRVEELRRLVGGLSGRQTP